VSGAVLDVAELDAAAARARARQSSASARAGGVGLAVATVGAATVAVVRDADTETVVVALVASCWALAALWIVVRRAVEPLGWLVGAAAAAAACGLLLGTWAQDGGATSLVRGIAACAVPAVLFHLAVTLPEGRATGRLPLVLLGYLSAVPVVVVLVRAAPRLDHGVVTLWLVALGLVALVSFVAVCRRATPRARARLQWDGWGVLTAGALAFVGWALAALTGWPEQPSWFAAAATVLVAIGLAASVDDRALLRADRVLVHTIVAAGLVVMVAVVYVVIVLGLNGSPSDDERTVLALSLGAAALAASLGLPARRRLGEFANQRVYGERSAPDEALRTFAGRMSRAVPMDELLLQLAESLRRSMELSRAEVWTGADGRLDRQVSVPDAGPARLELRGEELPVAARTHVVGNAWLAVWMPTVLDGREDRSLRAAPIAHLGELLGMIVVERTEDDPPFVEDEDRALSDLARQLGLALHNVRLDSALQASLEELQQRNQELVASRARLVAASDEARRRIERNLHDGAQQHLVAMAVKVGLARQLLARDPGKAEELLGELRGDVQVTVGELRELAHGIYPPLLRDRGLPEALVTAANRAPLETVVRAEGIERYPTDLEAAVYFCCLEAMQNAGKHAGDGSIVTVEVEEADGELRFSVADDGVGFEPGGTPRGHGFENMADRLGAMGGRLQVTSSPGSGTVVRGAVPFPT